MEIFIIKRNWLKIFLQVKQNLYFNIYETGGTMQKCALNLYLSRLSPNSSRSIQSQLITIGRILDWPDSQIPERIQKIDYFRPDDNLFQTIEFNYTGDILNAMVFNKIGNAYCRN